MGKEDIQDEIKETRDHIEATGSAMVEKLEILEGRLRENIDTVKRNFDLHYQADQHPLALFGGSLAVGYLLGSWFSGASSTGPAARSSSRPHNGVGGQIKKEIATTVKGIAAGALTSTLLEAGKRALLGRQSGNIDPKKEAASFGKDLVRGSTREERL